MSEIRGMYAALEAEQKIGKRLRSSQFNKIINDLAILFDIEIEVIQEWHIRFHFPKGRYDFYTTKGKGSWLSSNKWDKLNIITLKEFIREQYPDHPENKK